MCAKPKETVLPNGMTAYCLRKEEVPLLYQQVQEYLKNGIELDRGDTVFDVGANIGLFSLWLYEKLHFDLNIYAFEPIPVLYEILKRNAERLALFHHTRQRKTVEVERKEQGATILETG